MKVLYLLAEWLLAWPTIQSSLKPGLHKSNQRMGFLGDEALIAATHDESCSDANSQPQFTPQASVSHFLSSSHVSVGATVRFIRELSIKQCGEGTQRGLGVGRQNQEGRRAV